MVWDVLKAKGINSNMKKFMFIPILRILTEMSFINNNRDLGTSDQIIDLFINSIICWQTKAKLCDSKYIIAFDNFCFL